MIDEFFKRARNRLSTEIGHSLILDRDSDVYIAAYPRSGSTWLRTLLANILDESAQSNPDVFNLLIPAVSIRNSFKIHRLVSPRLMMTHGRRRSSIRKKIYLIRDGRDSFISSYHYHITRESLPFTIEEFYKLYHSQVYGLTWGQHTKSWLAKSGDVADEEMLMVRFDELKDRPETTIKQVCDFLALSVSNKNIERAISEASIERVRKIEETRQGRLASSDASFYRQGTSGQFLQDEYKSVIERFESDNKDALELAGYL